MYIAILFNIAPIVIAVKLPKLGFKGAQASVQFSYPQGCNAKRKVDGKGFCVSGTSVSGKKLDATLTIFDAKDSSKSVGFLIEVAMKNYTPVGLKVTANGCATVMRKSYFLGALKGAISLCAKTEGDGMGRYNVETKEWATDVQLQINGDARVMGYAIKKLDTTKTISANIGPDAAFGLDAEFTIFRKTGSDKGISAAITLDLDTLAQSLLSWHLVGEFELHLWLTSLSWKPSFELFNEYVNVVSGTVSKSDSVLKDKMLSQPVHVYSIPVIHNMYVFRMCIVCK
ncbi:hypothetical protein FOL47_010998 [Perkinsus chesapeaki]|uniref:Uncharacterized protein n=1 Tax=Perkinsus chesapeaki TaxID=330153 RepID=A0A7J6KZM8_PERCH|nr:hypothetical protein FOL47_010998 [Perkinsus chesapeaki]